jgi:hypothetical protein
MVADILLLHAEETEVHDHNLINCFPEKLLDYFKNVLQFLLPIEVIWIYFL